MALESVFDNAVFLVIAGIIVFHIFKVRSKMRGDAAAKEKGEALFRSMFPELQPHFHPKKVISYVLSRRGNPLPGGRGRVKGPPGFGDADAAEIEPADGKERVTLLDAAGATLASFLYEEIADGGVLRIGKGKMTVTLPGDGANRVRYWHPDREFKWKRDVWTFQSRMADREIESSDRTSFSSDSSSSSDSGSARTAAAAAGIVAAGGAFDGGGASAAWDGGSGGGSSAGGAFEGGSASATAY